MTYVLTPLLQNIFLVEPLHEFSGLFGNVLFLMEKRYDKQLDFDSYRRKFKATKDADKQRALKKDLDLAENTFKAMHNQLMEEMPKFWDAGHQFFSRYTTLT